MSGLIWKVVLTIMVAGQPTEFITTKGYDTLEACHIDLARMTRMVTEETWFLSCISEVHA